MGVGVPVPLNESTGEFEALLAKETVPEAAPVACGVNATVNCTLLPDGIVTGKDSPLRVNSELLALADVTVTLAPVALSVAGRFALVPTTTLPKAKLAGGSRPFAQTPALSYISTRGENEDSGSW